MSQRVESTGRDLVFLRRVLSRLVIDKPARSGMALYFDLISSPSRALVVDYQGCVVAQIDMCQMEAIAKEESERDRSLA